MEKLPVSLFRSTDDNAPPLSTEAGSFKTVLKACLVSGYGNKKGLGWEMPFGETTTTAVFRPTDPQSQRRYLKVVATGEAASNVAPYGRMSGLESGEDFFGGTGGTSYLSTHEWGKNINNWWAIVGTSRGFFMITYSEYGAQLLYFGDLPSCVAADNGNTFFWTTSIRKYMSSDWINTNIFAAKTWNALQNNAECTPVSLVDKITGLAYPSVITGGLTAAAVYIVENKHLRAAMPFFLRSQHTLKSFLPDKIGQIPMLKLDGSDDDYLVVPNYRDEEQYLINTTAWDWA